MAVDSRGSSLDRILTFCFNAGRLRILALSALLLTAVSYLDWVTGPDISLGVLYVLPVLLASAVLPPWGIVGVALVCAVLRRIFGIHASSVETILRFTFSVLSYTLAGLFVVAVVRNRKMALEHLAAIHQEQALRNEAEEQLRTLVESSPAGILTLDRRGLVLAANNSVNAIFGLAANQTVAGRQIETYLPVLADALRLDAGETPFRTAAQAQGRRENGEIFLADTWFSTYFASDGKRLAAIVVDSSEDMRDREEEHLRQLSLHSRIMAGAMLHEVRNLCSAISVAFSNMIGKNGSDCAADLEGLNHLVQGLTRVASLELRPRGHDDLEATSLKQVLDDLRIVIESSWLEIGGMVRWEVPPETPRVLAERHGLLQAFLNLAENSLRSVQDCPLRELTVSVFAQDQRTLVRFRDSGCGVSRPDRLFQPFQPGAESTGLGLYISRALLRSYGGELRFEPREDGASFVVELPSVEQRAVSHA
ncbi:MAG: ATP-binding protein [Bryobacteraceae bacterium]|jgi:PAS domain S-box-containing protein